MNNYGWFMGEVVTKIYLKGATVNNWIGFSRISTDLKFVLM
jgi:hypothetical protein